MKYENNESLFWPRKIKIVDVWINFAWAFISWLIWSILLLFIVFIASNFIDIIANFNEKNIWNSWNSPVFPFILSFITFIVWIIVCIISYYFLVITDSEKYKKTIIHFGQISFFSIIIYILFSPIYVYIWVQDYNNILYIFIIHILILVFWQILLLELLNNYRYILVGFYASFFWLLITGIIIFFIFSLFNEWYAKLLSLLLLLPLINWFIIFFKWIFELLYYNYYKMTWFDPLWDIFRQIEQEEQEQLKDVTNENSTY